MESARFVLQRNAEIVTIIDPGRATEPALPGIYYPTRAQAIMAMFHPGTPYLIQESRYGDIYLTSYRLNTQLIPNPAPQQIQGALQYVNPTQISSTVIKSCLPGSNPITQDSYLAYSPVEMKLSQIREQLSGVVGITDINARVPAIALCNTGIVSTGLTVRLDMSNFLVDLRSEIRRFYMNEREANVCLSSGMLLNQIKVLLGSGKYYSIPTDEELASMAIKEDDTWIVESDSSASQGLGPYDGTPHISPSGADNRNVSPLLPRVEMRSRSPVASIGSYDEGVTPRQKLDPSIPANFDTISRLPKDVLQRVALDFSPTDLINLCKTNKHVNRILCDNNVFWSMKFRKDFPNPEKEKPSYVGWKRWYRAYATGMSGFSTYTMYKICLFSLLGDLRAYHMSPEYKKAAIKCHDAINTIIESYNKAVMQNRVYIPARGSRTLVQRTWKSLSDDFKKRISQMPGGKTFSDFNYVGQTSVLVRDLGAKDLVFRRGGGGRGIGTLDISAARKLHEPSDYFKKSINDNRGILYDALAALAPHSAMIPFQLREGSARSLLSDVFDYFYVRPAMEYSHIEKIVYGHDNLSESAPEALKRLTIERNYVIKFAVTPPRDMGRGDYRRFYNNDVSASFAEHVVIMFILTDREISPVDSEAVARNLEFF